MSEETKEDATLFLIVCVEILSVPETRFCDKRLDWQTYKRKSWFHVGLLPLTGTVVDLTLWSLRVT